MKFSFAAILAVSAAVCFGDNLYLKNDFSNFQPTPKGQNPESGICSALHQGFSIAEENGNKYLQIRRDQAGLRQFTIGRAYNIMAYFDAKISMKVRLPKLYGGYFFFTSWNVKEWLGGIAFDSREKEILCYSVKNQWEHSGVIIPTEEWFDLSVNFIEAERVFTVTVKTADGKVQTSKPFPYRHNNGVRNLLFGNSPPAGRTGMDIDDIVITYADEMNIKNRFNGIENAAISLKGQTLEHKDGVFTTPVKVQLPATFDIHFSGAKHIKSVIVKLKETNTRFLPIEIIGSNAAGSGAATLLKGHINAQRKIYQNNFAADDFIRAQVVINGKGTITVESIYFAGMPQESSSEKVIAFKKNIYGDFPCAIWQDQSEAHLHLFNDRKDKKNHSVKITVAKRNTENAAFPERIVELKPGKNVITFPVTDLANGDYVVSVADNSGESDGVFKRLLRRYKKFEDTSAITEIGEVNNVKLHFPDNHFLEKADNASFVSGQAKLIEVVPRSAKDEDFCRRVNDISIKNGQVRIDYMTLNRNWEYGSEKYHRAVAPVGDLENAKWEIQTFDKEPPRDGMTTLIGGWGPPASHGDFGAKFSGEKEVYKMFDPAKDTPIDISKLKVRYSGAVANNTVMWKHSSQDWGVMKGIPRAFYLFYRRGVDDTVILNKEPFLVDKPSLGEYEEENTTHDNFCGQWLSDDGKTLYFCHARWLLPSYPYNTPPYDNMNGLRMLHLWKTKDGLNWEKTAFCPPTENESPVEQHYGANAMRLRGAKGLFIAFVLRYRSDLQQMDHYLAYSWDGGHWKKAEGTPFLENGMPGSFDSGAIVIGGGTPRLEMVPSINIGKDTYMNVFQVTDYYHHQAAQIVAFIKKTEFNVPFMKKAVPTLEQWPWFKQIGGWEGFVEHSKQSGCTVATAKMRQDGFFCVKADDNIAELTTKKITSKSKLFANMKIADNGFAEITLLDESNNPIPDYSKKLEAGFDEVDAEIFSQLPAQPFKVNIKMQNAELYTLIFK